MPTQQENECIIFSHYFPSPSSLEAPVMSFFITHFQIAKFCITFWAKFTKFKLLLPVSPELLHALFYFLFYFLLFRLVIPGSQQLQSIRNMILYLELTNPKAKKKCKKQFLMQEATIQIQLLTKLFLQQLNKRPTSSKSKGLSGPKMLNLIIKSETNWSSESKGLDLIFLLQAARRHSIV